MSMEYVYVCMYSVERPWRERSFASVTASSILVVVVVDCSQVDENRRSPCCVTNTSPRI